MAYEVEDMDGAGKCKGPYVHEVRPQTSSSAGRYGQRGGQRVKSASGK
jgi:hypothetical protein